MRVAASIFLVILTIIAILPHCIKTSTTTASIPKDKKVVRDGQCSPFTSLGSSREALTVQIILFDNHGNKREIIALKPQDTNLLVNTDCK